MIEVECTVCDEELDSVLELVEHHGLKLSVTLIGVGLVLAGPGELVGFAGFLLLGLALGQFATSIRVSL